VNLILVVLLSISLLILSLFNFGALRIERVLRGSVSHGLCVEVTGFMTSLGSVVRCAMGRSISPFEILYNLEAL